MYNEKFMDMALEEATISISTDVPLLSRCKTIAGIIEFVFTTINPQAKPTINANGICTKLPCINPNRRAEKLWTA